MPIRPSITKEGTDELREYDRRMKRGPRPPAPPKPTKAEREAFVRALLRLPVGEVMDSKTFMRRVTDFYSFTKFDVWGFELCILPLYKIVPNDMKEVTGASIMRAKVNERGIKLRCPLRGEQRTWYGQVIRWLQETEWY